MCKILTAEILKDNDASTFDGWSLSSTIRGGSGGPAGTVWAGPLFEFLTLLLAINHYKTTNYLPSKKAEQYFTNIVCIDHHIILLLTHIT